MLDLICARLMWRQSMDCCILGLGCCGVGGGDCLGTQGLEVAMGARESAIGRASLWGFKLACSYLFSPPLHPRGSFLLLCWQKKSKTNPQDFTWV